MQLAEHSLKQLVEQLWEQLRRQPILQLKERSGQLLVQMKF
jgi:hypothetical protein